MKAISNGFFSFRARSPYLYCLLEQGHFIISFTRVLSEDRQRVQGPASEMVWYTGYHDHHGYHGYHDYHGSNTQPFIFQRQYRNTLLNLNVMFSSDHSIYIHSSDPVENYFLGWELRINPTEAHCTVSPSQPLEQTMTIGPGRWS